MEHRTFKPASKEIEITTLSSNFHIEMNPTDAGHYDKHVIQEILKEIAQSGSLSSSVPFKVVVLNEVDKLTKEAQQALRRTMEKYSANCRLILCANSTCQVIEAIRSRCLLLRVASPTEEEIVSILQYICREKNLKISQTFAKRVAESSDRNLRRAILILQSAYMHKYPFSDDLPIPKTDWEKVVSQISSFIVEQQSPHTLINARALFYDLLSRCIPPELILRKLTTEVLALCDSRVKYSVAKWAAFYDHRLKTGNKPIFHLEAFVAKFMFVYKEFLIQATN